MNKEISISEAAKIIGVSNATIKNWAKFGYLNIQNVKPVTFFETDVALLKNNIDSGLIIKLQNRANKTGLKKTFIPKEYSNDILLIQDIDNIVSIFKKEQLDINKTMLYVVLRCLELKSELRKSENNQFIHLRSSIEKEITNWFDSLENKNYDNRYELIYNSINNIYNGDFLGFIYQSISQAGEKSNKGSYYTPSSIISESLNTSSFTGGLFLDPCCGTGNYLLHAAKILNLQPGSIYGFDIDKIAIKIARINLLLHFTNYNDDLNIKCINTLECSEDMLKSSIDFIATNPPWGSYSNTQVNGEILSNEMFSLFIAKSLNFIKDDGYLSFILPESFLNIKVHNDIRSLLLKNTCIIKIKKLGRAFSNVFTSAIRLDLIKSKYTSEFKIKIENEDGSTFFIDQDRFEKNDNNVFDINVNSKHIEILKEIYKNPHLTLKNNADWALGIVTGNNKKFIYNEKKEGMEQIIKGADISKFNIHRNRSFIDFKPDEFQQVANESLYRVKEKIIYKFISSKLVFAFDNTSCLTLNSANIIIPSIPNYTLKTTLAFLNSTIFDYIFNKKFATKKILRSNLESLPFPSISIKESNDIESLVNKIHDGDRSSFYKLDEIIFKCFNIDDDTIKIIKMEANGKY